MTNPISYNERLASLEGEVKSLKDTLSAFLAERSVDYIRAQAPKMSEIIDVVCNYYNVTVVQVTGSQRLNHVAKSRMIIYFLARKLTGMSLPQIGKRLGDRDHTTVWHGAQRIQVLSKVDEVLRDDLDILELKISEKILNRGQPSGHQVVHKLPVPA